MVKFKRVDPLEAQHVLAYLHVETFPSDEPCTPKPKDLWWVGFDAGLPVAFCVVRPLAGTSMWYLARAGVLKSHRGKGLQRRMIRLRTRAAFAAGAGSCITDCTSANAGSANNLIACGFRVYLPEYQWALPTSIYWRLNSPQEAL